MNRASLVPATWIPRRTVRLRLTLLYGGLFLVSGAALLAITYVLVVHNTTGFIFSGRNGLSTAIMGQNKPPSSGKAPISQGLTVSGRGVKPLTPAQAVAQTRELQAEANQQHSRVLDQLLIQSGVALAGMAVLSIGLGWVVAGRVLRPLRTITTTVQDISATNLHRRLSLAGPQDELKQLGDTFDALLARLEAAFQAQRHFVANASHELRTPLARQRTLAQVALADPDATAESLRAAHERVLASGAQQERLIEALLTLTRGQAGVETRQPFDLATLARQTLLAREPDAAQRGLEVSASLSPAPATGDPRLVERLIANLIDNALHHNVPGGRVEVATSAEAGEAVLTVSNTGRVIGPEGVEDLLQPFKRLGPDRTGQDHGVGLGLSIVRAIAEAHRATLMVGAPPDGGLRVQVTFPRQDSLNGGQP